MIEVHGLSTHYGGHPAVVDATFAVPRGQRVGLLGPAGAGKSALLRVLSGCLRPSSGSVRVAGHDVLERPREVRRRTGLLSQATPLYEDLRVEVHLALACRLHGVPPARRRASIDWALETCGLVDRRRDLIGLLPRGWRRRVGLAQALVHDPDVLLLDEPTTGLDPTLAGETRELIAGLGDGRTVVVASRQLPEIGATCDRVLLVRRGRVVADDTPDALSGRLVHGPGRRVDAVVSGPRTAIERELGQVAGVRGVVVTRAEGGWHRVTVTGEGEDLEEAVARAVADRGFGLRRLSSSRLSFEDTAWELAEAPV